MTEAFAKQIETEARQAMTELVAAAKLKKGDVLVVGCSSSEMVGGHIGKDSSIEAAQALYAGAAPVLAEKGIWLAAQCCDVFNVFIAPFTISITVSSLTAPYRSKVSEETCKSPIFTSLE